MVFAPCFCDPVSLCRLPTSIALSGFFLFYYGAKAENAWDNTGLSISQVTAILNTILCTAEKYHHGKGVGNLLKLWLVTSGFKYSFMFLFACCSLDALSALVLHLTGGARKTGVWWWCVRACVCVRECTCAHVCVLLACFSMHHFCVPGAH